MSKHDDVKALYNNYIMPTYAPSLTLVRGQGTRVWDADGKTYLDFIAGIAVLNLGHSHPRVVEAIREQCTRLIHVSNLYYNENQARLARKLSETGLDGKCFFCNSGAEANEALIKLARLWGHDQGRYEIISMKQSFHGRTLATAAATGQVKIQRGFEPMPDGFRYADFNAIDSVRGEINDKTVAILVEAVQGEGGIIPADPRFMRDVRALCDKHHLLMLCDEVQCGIGRTGHWFGYQAYDVVPDAFSTAKALGSGYPIGALAASPELSDVFQPGHHASTFGGTPLACAAALATLETIDEEGLVERVRTAGTRFADRLRTLAATRKTIVDIRGRGFMLGIVLDRPAAETCARLASNGLLTLATAGNVVRLLPPLNVSDDELDQAAAILERCL